MLITPNDIRLVIMTVNRTPEYIHKTLASLFISDSLVHQLKGIHIMVGGANMEYLNQYRHHNGITIHSMTSEESVQISDWIVHRKFCHNYHRCLTIPEDDYKGLCICEDDIMFQDRFVEKMVAAINEMENKHNLEKYLLDLYLPYGFFPDPSFRTGNLCAKYYPQRFYGTQCIYYPKSIVSEIAQLIYELGVAKYLLPGDVLIGQYATEKNILYGTKRSLVQHVGFHSTGLAGVFHRSPSFNEFETTLSKQTNDTGEMVQFNFRESVGGAIKALGFGAQYKGLELIFEVTPSVPEIVTGDLFRLCQVLHLLIENAIRFTSKGEVILYIDVNSIKDSDVLLQFTVNDTGPGTQRQMCAKLQEDNLSIPIEDRPLQNLAISINLVDSMGGEIWVEDDEGIVSQLEGSIFQFTIPFTIKNLVVNHVVVRPIQELTNRSVLIVDNNDANRKMLSNMLISCGVLPIVANCGREALKLLMEKKNANEPVWMLLLDAHMPGMDGFDVAKQINANPVLVENMLMMLSEEVKGDKAALCREVGIRNHINKPILYSELLEAMLYFASNNHQNNSISESVFYKSNRPITTNITYNLDCNIHLQNDKLIEKYLTSHNVKKLQIGCGSNLLNGWLNTDAYNLNNNVCQLDAGITFPFENGIFQYVYSEHIFEHLNYNQAKNMISECFRVLNRGGLIRISTPNLDFLINLYLHPNSSINRKYISWATKSHIKDVASDLREKECLEVFVINNFFKAWGHQIIHNFESIKLMLNRAGFKEITRCDISKSTIPEFINIERHGDVISHKFNKLESIVIEAKKY